LAAEKVQIKSNHQIKSNLFAINKVRNITVNKKITFHLAGQTGDSFALTSALPIKTKPKVLQLLQNRSYM